MPAQRRVSSTVRNGQNDLVADAILTLDRCLIQAAILLYTLFRLCHFMLIAATRTCVDLPAFMPAILASPEYYCNRQSWQAVCIYDIYIYHHVYMHTATETRVQGGGLHTMTFHIATLTICIVSPRTCIHLGNKVVANTCYTY